MNQILPFLHRLYFEAPWCYLSWPAAAMVAGTILSFLSRSWAARLGVVPRKLSGLIGLITAPFVHANIAHLAANLPPFIVLGALVLRHDQPHFIEVAVTIALGEGALLWLFGRNASHVGMSGVIFGFLGYLLAIAWFTPETPDLLVAGASCCFTAACSPASSPSATAPRGRAICSACSPALPARGWTRGSGP